MSRLDLQPAPPYSAYLLYSVVANTITHHDLIAALFCSSLLVSRSKAANSQLHQFVNSGSKKVPPPPCPSPHHLISSFSISYNSGAVIPWPISLTNFIFLTTPPPAFQKASRLRHPTRYGPNKYSSTPRSERNTHSTHLPRNRIATRPRTIQRTRVKLKATFPGRFEYIAIEWSRDQTCPSTARSCTHHPPCRRR